MTSPFVHHFGCTIFRNLSRDRVTWMPLEVLQCQCMVVGSLSVVEQGATSGESTPYTTHIREKIAFVCVVLSTHWNNEEAHSSQHCACLHEISTMWSSALVLSLMMVITPVAVASAGVAPVRPHVFFLLADDLGTSDIGYNDKSIISPTLDGLAREGIILSDHCEFTAVSG